MPDATLYVKHPTSGLMIPVKADADGKLVISDADPFTVAQATPENLKHVPHGYYAAGPTYLPFKVDADGVLQTSGAVTGSLNDLSDVSVPAPADQDLFFFDDATGLWKSRALVVSDVPTAIQTLTITFIIDGGASAITTGEKGHLEIPFACTIQQVTMLADQSGSIVVDIWKDTYTNFPPTNTDSITAAAPPTITTATKSQDGTLTGWTKTIIAGDILAFNVDSCTTITRVTISLKVVKT